MARFPDFIIPGTQKGGTTTLYYYLSQHPACALPAVKEPHFFSRERNMADLESYKRLFPNGGLTGEASTDYLYDPRVPERMARVLPKKTKFIFLLRNPVERTISAYWMLQKRGAETRSITEALLLGEGTLRRAIEKERRLLKKALAEGHINMKRFREAGRYDDPTLPFLYLTNSVYSSQIQRFLVHFPKRNMLFLLTEDLLRNPTKTMKQVTDFLGINPLKNIKPAIKNKTYVPRSTIIAKVFQALKESTQPFLKIKSPIVLKLYRALAMQEKPPSPPEIHTYLASILNEECSAVERLTGLSTRIWRDKLKKSRRAL